MKKRAIFIAFSVDNPNLYRIAWKDTLTGRTGFSSYRSTYEQAKSSVKELNMLYPKSIHWLEPSPRLN